MTRIIRAFLFLSGLACVTYAQSPVNYFPLSLGNRYHWYGSSNCPPYHADTVYSKGWAVIDTLSINGKPYYRYPLLYWGFDTVRVDSAGNVLFHYLGEDRLYYKMDAAVGETWQVVLPIFDYEPDTFNVTMRSRTDTIRTHLGTFYNCLQIYFDWPKGIDDEHTHWLAPGVGLIFKCVQEPSLVYEAIVDGDTFPGVTSVKDPLNSPGSFELFQNYPNPFNPTTTIRYRLSAVNRVTLKVYDILGREVRTLVDERQTAGEHIVWWDGKDNDGNLVPSGAYFCQLQVGSFKVSEKLSLVK